MSNCSCGCGGRSYLIKRTSQQVSLSGEVAGTAWAAANTAEINIYPWYKSGKKQATTMRVLYDDRAMYVQFLCEDLHIYSVETKLNGNVYLDSCVEFFVEPSEKGYFNFEANCCGVFHLGFGPGRPDRKLITPELAAEIKVKTSISSKTKEESASDNGWWLAAELPFETLTKFTGVSLKPSTGTVWRANAYRCGGKTDDQYAMWNLIGQDKPDFHRPEFFGTLRFD